MDLDILYWLQTNRPEFVGKLMSVFTFFGNEIIAIGIACLVYWCLSRKTGTRLLLSMLFGLTINQLLKISFAARRPWVRSAGTDKEIVPYANAIDDATAYSFPSGHTANAAAAYGALVYGKGVKRVFKILAWILVVLVGVSRLYLGVHTPQDVLASLVLGVILVFLMGRLSEKLEENPKLDLPIALSAFALAAAALIVALTRKLPGDEEEIARNTMDVFKTVGAVCGMMLGWMLERRFVRFDKPATILSAALRLVIGMALVFALLNATKPLFISLLGESAGGAVRYFITCFVAIFVWPLLFKRLEKRLPAKKENKG
ncbi:MAG: phosphatase PAP2 family protein [Clostridia bacterium]|nr:phosphatase PAP2 family protein [Clostridia bacterium]